MSHFTSGPWDVFDSRVDDGGGYEIVQRATDEHIAWVDSFGEQTQKANADLMAAAPDMYEALKEVERHCPCGARPESPRTHPHVGGCRVGAAISKAAPPDKALNHE